jgi:uncharacterized LabA/DUF88 family protein
MRLVLIDGSNLYESALALGIRVDYKRLLSFLNPDGELLRSYYFTALRDKAIESPIRKTVDWLSHNGYVCVTKQTKEWTDVNGILKIKGNVDVDISVYAFKYAKLVTEIYLFSGDGDFTIMVKELQETFALKVYVVSSLGLVSTELRRQADKFISLSDIRDDIQRES